MSINYILRPANKVNYSKFKRDIFGGKIKGLKGYCPVKGEYIPKSKNAFYIVDNDNPESCLYVYNAVTAGFKQDKGDILFTAYNLSANDYFSILGKIAAKYNCEMEDEEGAIASSKDFVSNKDVDKELRDNYNFGVSSFNFP